MASITGVISKLVWKDTKGGGKYVNFQVGTKYFNDFDTDRASEVASREGQNCTVEYDDSGKYPNITNIHFAAVEPGKAASPPPATAAPEDPKDKMSKPEWAEKDRLERETRVFNNAVGALVGSGLTDIAELRKSVSGVLQTYRDLVIKKPDDLFV